MSDRAVLAALLLAAALPAGAALFDDEEARRRIEVLRQEFAQQGRDNEQRIARLEESIRNIGVVELLQQLERINAEIARLRGQLEVFSYENQQVQKRQRDFYLDLDSRLKRLESAALAAPSAATPDPGAAPGAEPESPAEGQPPKAASREDQAAEMKAYDAASGLFRRNDFGAAIDAFRAFVKEHPGSPLVANANYWIGISYANLRDYHNALAAQQEVVARFPQSPKAPDALLAIAAIQLEQGDTGAARDTLEDIIARFPGSEAAGKARMRLAGLRR